MKKTRTPYDEAPAIYKEMTGREPTAPEITNLWHEYANNWKHYNGLKDYMIEMGY